jgi:hypothetical protein
VFRVWDQWRLAIRLVRCCSWGETPFVQTVFRTNGYNTRLGATQVVAATPITEIKLQIEHPTPEAIHSRAVEVFDGEELAREWLDSTVGSFRRQDPTGVCGVRR